MSWNAALHPRAPKGAAGGGQFAKGSAPAPSKTASKKTGGRYSKKQFGELQSLQKQHASGKKLTARQAHALHVAHELHLQHEAHVKAAKAAPKRKAAAKPKTAKKTAAKTTRTAVPRAVRN